MLMFKNRSKTLRCRRYEMISYWNTYLQSCLKNSRKNGYDFTDTIITLNDLLYFMFFLNDFIFGFKKELSEEHAKS